MVKAVKRRRYDNSRRQAQTRATRVEVITAARQLFVERGYPATTIEAIADAAATPLATVYRLFGSKRGILSAVLDVAFGGDDQPIAFADRPGVQAALAEPDPGRLLDAFAHICRELLDRSAPIQHVLASAAAVDPEAADLLEITRRQRLLGQSRVIRALADRDALPDSLGEREAADIVYTLMSPEVHRILTMERGWSPDRYQQWLATALHALLL
ncbi:MAG: TetR/AcrR family transcriptional regulator [Actinomycetota bacterium]|nr:TetR/AcrR family transcriptional regulator [Actinomycetota bacterium]